MVLCPKNIKIMIITKKRWFFIFSDGLFLDNSYSEDDTDLEQPNIIQNYGSSIIIVIHFDGSSIIMGPWFHIYVIHNY